MKIQIVEFDISNVSMSVCKIVIGKRGTGLSSFNHILYTI